MYFLSLATGTMTLFFATLLAWLYKQNHKQNQKRKAEKKAQRQLECMITALPYMVLRLDSQGRILEIHLPSELGDLEPLIQTNRAKGRPISQLFLQREMDFSQLFERTCKHSHLEIAQYQWDDRTFEVRMIAQKDGEVMVFMGEIPPEDRKVQLLKDDFISTVSHELRTPLTALCGYLGLMAGGALGKMPPYLVPVVERAKWSAHRLKELVDSLLDIQKMEGGKMTFSLKTTSLDEILDDSMRLYESYASQYNVTLKLNNHAYGLKIKTDSLRLQQVLSNLLSNGIKYSPAGGEVVLSSFLKDDGLFLSVQDGGAGIPQAFRERVFEKFSQSDSPLTRKVGGTGLGLHISKQIVTALGGTLFFKTEEGQGTIFFVKFPIRVLQGSWAGIVK